MASGWLDAPAAAQRRVAEMTALSRPNPQGRFHARAAARHGRLEPVPRRAAQHRFAGADGFPRSKSSTRPTRRRSRRSRRTVDLAKTLVIVASKSGSTLEPNIFKAYFWERMVKAVGATRPGASSSRSPTRAASSRPSPSQKATAASSPATRRSAGATRRSPTSAWCRRRSIGIDLARFTARAPTEMASACNERGPKQSGRDARRAARHAARSSGATSSRWSCRRGQEPGRMARAAGRRIDGQARQGHRADRPRAARQAPRGVRQRPAVRVTCNLEAAPDKRRTRRSGRSKRAGQPVVRIRIADKIDLGAEFFPLGDRDCGRGLDPRAPSRSISPTSRPARSSRAS